MTTDAEFQAELDKLIYLATVVEPLSDVYVATAFALMQTEKAIVPVPAELLSSLLAAYSVRFPEQTRRVFGMMMKMRTEKEL